MVQNIIGYNC